MDYRKWNFGWILTIFVCLMPAVIWFFVPSTGSRFDNFIDISYSLGKVFGLVGITMFAVNLILATRLPFIEDLFHGLNNVYNKHNILGQIALILLLFHPLLLLSIYSSDAISAAEFLWLSSDWARNWGIISLVSMIALIALTIYFRPRYHIWKWTHKFLGLAFFFGALHALLIPSDVTRFLPLKIYVFTFAFLGILAFLYRSVFGIWLVKKHKYAVEKVVTLNAAITEVVLRPLSQPMKFKPGQFIFINYIKSEIGSESHPFSLTSSPSDETLRIGVKNLGDYTGKINQLRPGTVAELEGPFGKFTLDDSANRSQIWIAGGIGITPFISLARSLRADAGYKIDFYYCVKNAKEAVYLETLSKISNSLNGSLNVIPYYSEQNPSFTADVVVQRSGDISAKDFYICAPVGMISAVRGQLLRRGIDKKRIHSEEFSF